MHPSRTPWAAQPPPWCGLQTGNPSRTTSYSLAWRRGSCGGPEINSLLQRKVLQSCPGRAAKSSGPGQEETQGGCSELRHPQGNPF
uniref:Uncharacterized protein n=1 Tax=Suricata suricatta TaxID=37032 RepID=A0A673UMP6_SURSU